MGELLEDAKTGLVRSAKLQSDEREFPYIKMQNFDIDGEWHLDDIARVDASDDEIAKSNLKEGDVLFNTRNSTELVGKTAIWNGPEGTYLYNNNLLRMRFCPAMSQGWAAFHFRCPQFRKTLETIKSATTSVAAIYQKPLLQQNLRVPPLNEQRRIVAKIEELTARSRNAKRALDAIPPLLERFRQSVLAAAFRGDLTKQWRQQNPNTEPASELLKRIRQERRHRWEQDYLQTQKTKGKQPKNDKWKAKYKEPDPVDANDLPDLPEGWCWASFDAVADIAANLVSPQDYPDSPHIAPNHIESKTGKLLPYTTIGADGVTSPKHKFFEGQVLYSKIRPYLAKAVLVDFEGLCSADMYPVDPLLDGKFLWLWIISARFTELASRHQGRTVLPKINQKALSRLPVPVAPLSEQRVIGQMVEETIQFTYCVSRASEKAQARTSSLDQSILAKAFRGELVPQDPNDEPASALLERTRAETEKSKKQR